MNTFADYATTHYFKSILPPTLTISLILLPLVYDSYIKHIGMYYVQLHSTGCEITHYPSSIQYLQFSLPEVSMVLSLQRKIKYEYVLCRLPYDFSFMKNFKNPIFY